MKRGFAAVAAVASVVGLGVTLSPSTHAAAAGCTTWNLYTDFRTTPNQANPNPDSCATPGVWTFDKSTAAVHDPSVYVPLDTYTDDYASASGLDGWYNSASGSQLPVVAKNTNATPVSFATATAPPHSIVVHPGAGSATEGYYVVVGWRSPVATTVSVTGGVSDDDPNGGDGIAWSVDLYKGSTNDQLTNGFYPNGGAQAFQGGTGGPGSVTDIPVAVGDVLYFVVDPGGDDLFDSTDLDVTITGSPPVNTPEAPLGAVAFTGIGAAAVALWVRRALRRRAADQPS